MYLLRVPDRNAVASVCDFFRRVHVSVWELGDGLLGVSVTGAPSKLHGWREITGYVTTWNALNPTTPVELVDSAD